MTVRLRAGATTDVGRVRTINQDSFLVLDDRGLYVVADGMGGHQGGEVASTLAVEALRATFVGGTSDALAEAIEEANLRIHERGEADPDLQGMGTTVVAVAVVEDDEGGSLLIANVGDSRAYLFRDGDLTQLTEDHSMVADLVREGRITEAEAEVHPQRNIVTRVLGVYDQVDIDLWPVDVVRGDRLLLCSDGLFNEVAADQTASVLRRLSDPQEAADELVRLANEGGGRDNITVLVVDVVDDGGVAEAASSALAGEPSGLTSDGPDLAGFSTASRRRAPSLPTGTTTTRSPPAPERVPLRSRLSWRVVGFALLARRGHRRRLRHDPVVRHGHVLRGLRPRRGRDLPGPARRRAVDRPDRGGPHRHRPRRRAREVPRRDRGGQPAGLAPRRPGLRLEREAGHRPHHHDHEHHPTTTLPVDPTATTTVVAP